MNQDRNPNEIEQLKTMLAKSLDAGAGEDVPPLPENLRDRISGQYGKAPATAPALGEGFFTRLANLFARPAWAGAAAAVALLLVAGVIFMNPTGDALRGSADDTATVAIVLYQLDADAERAIEESGYFDAKALHVVTSDEELQKIDPPKIVINGRTGQILSFGDDAGAPQTTALPADPAQLADIVAKMLRELK